jgi:3-oxoacyl-[acyl-carrier-protein] synthase-3
MENKYYAKIVGLGSSLGNKRITNLDLAGRLGLSAEEIEVKTGIRYRYHCDSEKENLYVLMASAAEQALKSANLPKEKINGIFSACNPTGDYLLPNTSSIVANLMELPEFYNGGISTGCSGGLTALDAACNKLPWKNTQNYLVLGGDQTSRIVKPGSSDEILFSDGASGIIVSNDPFIKGYYSIDKVDNKCFPEKSKVLSLGRKDSFLDHDGKAVYQFATRTMKNILEMLEVNKFPKDVYFIPHQANLRIINRLTRDLDHNLVYKKGIVNIGNTSSASAFIGLEEVNRKNLSPHKKIILGTFGEGLTVALAKITSSGKPLPEKLDEVSLKEKYMEIYKRKWN